MRHPSIRDLVLLPAFSLVLLLAPVLSTQHSQAAGGGGFPAAGSGTPQSDRTPEERAKSAYNSGLRAKKKAWKYEKKALDANTDKARTKLLAKADKQYHKAIKSQRRAFKLDPRLFQALNELGYAYRKTGDYKNAMAAYNAALKMKPDYLEAIEYRAEALMALGYYDETKKAYMHLFRRNETLAEQLMQAMLNWVKQQNGALNEKQKPFADWVTERGTLLGQSRNLSLNNSREW